MKSRPTYICFYEGGHLNAAAQVHQWHDDQQIMTVEYIPYAELDLTDRETLSAVSTMCRIIRGVLLQEMAAGTHYKTIYQQAKAQLVPIMALWNAPGLVA